MNTTMADGAHDRLVAQIGESLFDQPGMTLTEQANRVRELRGGGPALLGPRGQGDAVVTDEMVDNAWHRFEAAMQASDGDAPEDRILSETIDQRDRYHEMADDLAGHIAAITGVDVGEHSSANCPWQNAIEAAEAYQPAQAVDLGRWSQRHAEELQQAIHTALSAHAGSLSQKKRSAISDYVKRLLIDSQAVRNG